MKRQLILLRHAKSSWKHDLPDHERPLNKRGRRDAPRIGAAIAELGWVPERVVCSTAARTRETLRRVIDQLSPLPEITFDERLYLGDLAEIRGALDALPAELGRVMVVGHNPGWEDAVEQLSGIPTRITTCNAALLEGAGGSWGAALQGAWDLVDVLRPRPPKG